MRPQLSISALSFLLLFMSHSSAGLVEIANVEELRRLSEDHICYVVGYFENLDSAEAGLYRAAVADEFNFKDDFAQTVCRGIPVAISSDDGVRKVLGIKGEQGIVMISEGARSLFSFRNMDFPIKRWIETSPVPLVSEFNINLSPNIFQDDPTNYIMLLAPKSSADFPIIKEAFTQAAQHLRLKTRFVLVDTDDKDNVNYMNSFVGYKGGQSPAVYGVTLGAHGWEKFLTDFDEISTENVLAYNERLLAGELKRYLKSEEIPEDWDANTVKVLIGKNFHEVIKSSGKSVFVLFTSPWSPYCKTLEPIWEELGEKLSDSEKVMIAKINSAHGTNEIEGLHINGEPTMLFFPAGSNEVIEYNGQQTLEDLAHFVNENIKIVERIEL